MSINLDKLSASELDALIQAAAEQKKRVQRERLGEVRNRLIALAQEEGFSIEELFGDSKTKTAGKTRRTVAPKFRDPKDPTLTWTGRGKRPRWFQAALDAGISADQMTI